MGRTGKGAFKGKEFRGKTARRTAQYLESRGMYGM